MKMKVLIIEDEMLARQQIIHYLSDINLEIEVVGTLESVAEGTDWFQKNLPPDLIISDIKLTDGLSFEIFQNAKPECPVIFTTAYDQYAIKAFELNSIGYLLKPFDKEKLRESVEKVKVNSPAVNNLDLRQLADMIFQQRPEYKSRFLVKIGQKIKAISVDKIAYFYSHDKLTFLQTRMQEKFPLDQSLDELQNLLDPTDFFRLNRKFIVHFEGIKEVHPYFKGRLKVDLQPPMDEDIVVSSEKTPSFKAWLDK